MESKQLIDALTEVAEQHGFLLIEPVWNRNVHPEETLAPQNRLLIEPVWNRNFEWLVMVYDNGLLIEPVWNRNLLITTRCYMSVFF